MKAGFILKGNKKINFKKIVIIEVYTSIKELSGTWEQCNVYLENIINNNV